MIRKLFIVAATGLSLMAACQTKKRTTKSDNTQKDAPIIMLDTVRVDYETNKGPEEVRTVYRATNNRLNDIVHTRLEVSFDWPKCYLYGTATIDMKQYFYPSEMVYLNARGMDIAKVEAYDIQNNKPVLIMNASYKYENDSIKINLGRKFTAKENYRIVVHYTAKPNEVKAGGSNAIMSDKGLYFINPVGDNQYKMPQIWTQGETQSNSVWFPTIDSPNEKMTQEILMTVGDKYTTLSNGVLINSKKNNDGSRTDHWKMDVPHSPYLVMMAVGQFRKVVDEPWNGKEVSYYVEKEYEPHAKGIFGDTREMIEFYSSRLGVPYPWPKYAQIAVRDYVSGAMENTSATLHGDFAVYQTTREMVDGKKGTDIIAHELFHQWFGDYVTCESWSNLPLNESFATYGEYLWEEYKYGRDAADQHHAASRSGYMMSDKEVDLIRFDYDNREDMFDGFSYNKGGQVLHMLRKAVGDDAFFASLKLYHETNKFKAAEIHHLRLAFEEVTGQDLNWFFNQWFLSKGRPNLKVTQQYIAQDGVVELTVEQKQDLKNYPLYQLPIDIDVYVNNKASRTRIFVTEKKQTFRIKCAGQPQLVNFDAERQLLCDLEYVKSKEEYVFQYKNAPLYDDRIEALKKLEEQLSADESVYELFRSVALNDNFGPIRNYAMNKLSGGPSSKQGELKSVYLDVYQKEKKTTIRANALAMLNKKFGSDNDIIALNEKALQEQSYAICSEALSAIAKRDPKAGLEKAKLFENEVGKDIIFTVSDIYGNHGTDDHLVYFQNTMRYVNGFEMLTFCSNYIKAAKRATTPGAAIGAAMDFEHIAKGSSKLVRYSGVKGIKDLVGVWEAKEKMIKQGIERARQENKDVTSLEKELKTASETKAILQKMYDGVK